MFSINRSAALIRAKQPMIDWINSQDPEDLVAEQAVNREVTVMLVPDYDYEEDMVRYVEDSFEEIFAHELESWFTNEDCWPTPRTIDVFRDWFSVEIHSVVFDLVDEDFDGVYTRPRTQ